MDVVEKPASGPFLGISLIRALTHFQRHEFVHLSATRWTQTVDERAAANQGIEGTIKALNLGFVTMVGLGLAEQLEHTLEPSVAISYFVPNQTRLDTKLPDFLAQMLGLASAYRQKYVLHGVGDGTANLIRASGEVAEHYADWHPTGITFFKVLLRKVPLFHLECLGRAYQGGPMLTTYVMAQHGEIIDPERWPTDPRQYTPSWSLR